MDHNPIGAVINPTFVGVAGDIDASRTDIASSVFVMPERRRELEHVDIVVFVHVVEKSTFLDEFRGYRFDTLIIVFPNLDEIHFGFARRKPKRKSQSLAR